MSHNEAKFTFKSVNSVFSLILWGCFIICGVVDNRVIDFSDSFLQFSPARGPCSIGATLYEDT